MFDSFKKKSHKFIVHTREEKTDDETRCTKYNTMYLLYFGGFDDINPKFHDECALKTQSEVKFISTDGRAFQLLLKLITKDYITKVEVKY